MSKMNIELIKDIKDYDLTVYDDIIKRYIDYIKVNRAVIAVYQIGSITNPGISDIDLVVVVDDVDDPIALNSLSVNSFENSELSKYLFIHEIYIYDRKSFNSFLYTVYVNDIRLLWGRPLEIEAIQTEHVGAISLQNIFDFVSSRLIQFYQILASGRLSMRGTLVRVSSIKHSYDLLQKLGVTDREIENFIYTVFEMRRDNRNLTLNDLFSVFIESFQKFSRIVWLAGECFVERYLPCYETVDPGNSLKLNSLFLMRFVKETNEPNPPRRTDPTILYPDVAYYHYRAFTKFKCMIATWAQNLLSGNHQEYYELDASYSQALQKRIRAISGHYAFLSRNRVHYPMKAYAGFTVNL